MRACGNRKTKGSKDGGEEQTVLVRPWNKSMDVLSWKGKGQVGPGETSVEKNTRGGKGDEGMARRESNEWNAGKDKRNNGGGRTRIYMAESTFTRCGWSRKGPKAPS